MQLVSLRLSVDAILGIRYAPNVLTKLSSLSGLAHLRKLSVICVDCHSDHMHGQFPIAESTLQAFFKNAVVQVT